MQITLRLSRFNDLDLYAYFMGVDYRRSTLVKQLLRDYIRQEHTVRLSAPDVSAQTFTDPAVEKQLVIPVTLGKSDEDIIQYLSDCPNRMRGKCVKSVLRMMLAPYTQCAYHFSPVTPYAPYCERPPIAASIGGEMTQLLSLLIGQGLQVPQAQAPQPSTALGHPQVLQPQIPKAEFCEPSVLAQIPEPVQTEEVAPFGRAEVYTTHRQNVAHSEEKQEEDTKLSGASLPEEPLSVYAETTNTSTGEDETADDNDALLAMFGVDY